MGKNTFGKTMPRALSQNLKIMGEQIMLARKRRHLSMQDIADRATVTRLTVSKVEHGDPTVPSGWRQWWRWRAGWWRWPMCFSRARSSRKCSARSAQCSPVWPWPRQCSPPPSWPGRHAASASETEKIVCRNVWRYEIIIVTLQRICKASRIWTNEQQKERQSAYHTVWQGMCHFLTHVYFKLHLYPCHNFYQQLLWQRENIEVISPQSVTEEMLHIAQSILDKYK